MLPQGIIMCKTNTGIISWKCKCRFHVLVTDRVKMNPLAYNLYGLLLEKQGLYKQAATALQM